jgi:chromosome segregation ATPase
MPPTTESEIKELRDLVIGLREEIRVGFANNDTKFAELNGTIQAIDQKLSGDIKNLDQKLSGDIKNLDQKLSGSIQSLDQKVSGLDDRLKTQDGKLWTLVTIILGTASTLLIKILGFPNSP